MSGKKFAITLEESLMTAAQIALHERYDQCIRRARESKHPADQMFWEAEKQAAITAYCVISEAVEVE